MISKLANILLLQDSPKPPSPSPPLITSTPPPPHNPAHQGHQPSCLEMLVVPRMDNSYAVHKGYPPPMAHGFGYPLACTAPLASSAHQDKSAPTQPGSTRPAPTQTALCTVVSCLLLLSIAVHQFATAIYPVWLRACLGIVSW